METNGNKVFFLSKTCLSLDIMTFFIGKKYIVVKDDLEGGSQDSF